MINLMLCHRTRIVIRPLCNAPSCVLPGNGGIPVSPYSHLLHAVGFQLPSQVHSDSNPTLPYTNRKLSVPGITILLTPAQQFFMFC